MVTCTAIALGILLGNLSGNLPGILPLWPQDAIQLRIHKLVPLAKMLALAAFVTHAELSQNLSRGGIVFEMRSENSVQLQIFKSVAQHFPSCLCGVALPPIRRAQP